VIAEIAEGGTASTWRFPLLPCAIKNVSPDRCQWRVAVGSAYLLQHERAVIQNGGPRLGRSCPWGGDKRVGAPEETYTEGRGYGDDDHELLWNADHHAGHGLPETQRAERPRVTRRGSSGAYNPALLSPPSLPLSQPSAGVYIPPPVANPSAQINQLNHSFPLNGGLGNNPTNRDAYIRYNLTR
jgi:hypothetical protein